MSKENDEHVDIIMRQIGGDMKDVVPQGGGWSCKQYQTADNGYVVIIRVQPKPEEDDMQTGGILVPV